MNVEDRCVCVCVHIWNQTFCSILEKNGVFSCHVGVRACVHLELACLLGKFLLQTYFLEVPQHNPYNV